MPFWIEGWVEISRDVHDPDETGHWSGVLRVLPLVDGADDFSEAFFGLSKRAAQDTTAPAARRGLPPDPSHAVQEEMARIAAFEARHGAGERGGYTYATREEIRAFLAASPVTPAEDFRLVLDLMGRIATARSTVGPPPRVRLVVWYNW